MPRDTSAEWDPVQADLDAFEAEGSDVQEVEAPAEDDK